jgi:hypothetical protein
MQHSRFRAAIFQRTAVPLDLAKNKTQIRAHLNESAEIRALLLLR